MYCREFSKYQACHVEGNKSDVQGLENMSSYHNMCTNKYKYTIYVKWPNTHMPKCHNKYGNINVKLFY